MPDPSPDTTPRITMRRPIARSEFRPLYRLDAEALREARESARLTAAGLAARAGWSRQRQTQLEAGDCLVNAETFETLSTVLRRAGVDLVEVGATQS
jgi:predicted transcriptional regulator